MKIKVYPLVLLLMLIMTPALKLQSAEPAKSLQRVEARGKLITIEAKDADLSSLLKEIGLKTRVRMDIGKGVAGKKITINLKNVGAESALRTILGSDYFFIMTKEKADEKYILKQLKVLGEFSINHSTEKMATINIPYGSGKEEVGVLLSPPVGPQSFAIDAKGSINILDSINQRVQIFSTLGKILSTIPLKEELFGADIVVDDQDFLYISDSSTRQLYQCNRDGNSLRRIRIVRKPTWQGQGEMHISSNDTIYLYVCTENMCGDFIIGKIMNGTLIQPSIEGEEPALEEGRHGLSGRIYRGRLVKHERCEIEFIEKGDLTSKLIIFPLKGVDLFDILDEDKRGNFFILTERPNEKDDLEEVHRFNLDGVYLDTVLIPPKTSSFFWTVKHHLVGPDGTIIKFTLEEEKLRLDIFKNKQRFRDVVEY